LFASYRNPFTQNNLCIPFLLSFLPFVGKTLTSVEFSTLVQKSMEEGGATVNFIIGAADGLPDEIKQDPKINKISLSQMTFTHQMARLLLIEQIYRATEIQKGSGYHKD